MRFLGVHYTVVIEFLMSFELLMTTIQYFLWIIHCVGFGVYLDFKGVVVALTLLRSW